MHVGNGMHTIYENRGHYNILKTTIKSNGVPTINKKRKQQYLCFNAHFPLINYNILSIIWTQYNDNNDQEIPGCYIDKIDHEIANWGIVFVVAVHEFQSLIGRL